MTQVAHKTIAARMAALCDPNHIDVVVNHHHEGFPGMYVMRVYGRSRKASGPVGLWGLLTDAELAELGVESYRFQGGGILLPKDSPRYHNTYALAVAVWHLLGHDTHPDVHYL